jgi:hypothetical protein
MPTTKLPPDVEENKTCLVCDKLSESVLCDHCAEEYRQGVLRVASWNVEEARIRLIKDKK